MIRSQVVPALAVGVVLGIILAVAALALRPISVHATSGGAVGRYQISAWASYSGARVHHSGYYVLDTVTGKVVDKGHEIHGIASGPGRKP